MAYNWLMMTSSGDDNRPSGSLGLLTDKTKKNKKQHKPKAEQETAQPTAARFNYVFSHIKCLISDVCALVVLCTLTHRFFFRIM